MRQFDIYSFNGNTNDPLYDRRFTLNYTPRNKNVVIHFREIKFISSQPTISPDDYFKINGINYNRYSYEMNFISEIQYILKIQEFIKDASIEIFASDATLMLDYNPDETTIYTGVIRNTSEVDITFNVSQAWSRMFNIPETFTIKASADEKIEYINFGPVNTGIDTYRILASFDTNVENLVTLNQYCEVARIYNQQKGALIISQGQAFETAWNPNFKLMFVDEKDVPIKIRNDYFCRITIEEIVEEIPEQPIAPDSISKMKLSNKPVHISRNELRYIKKNFPSEYEEAKVHSEFSNRIRNTDMSTAQGKLTVAFLNKFDKETADIIEGSRINPQTFEHLMDIIQSGTTEINEATEDIPLLRRFADTFNKFGIISADYIKQEVAEISAIKDTSHMIRNMMLQHRRADSPFFNFINGLGNTINLYNEESVRGQAIKDLLKLFNIRIDREQSESFPVAVAQSIDKVSIGLTDNDIEKLKEYLRRAFTGKDPGARTQSPPKDFRPVKYRLDEESKLIPVEHYDPNWRSISLFVDLGDKPIESFQSTATIEERERVKSYLEIRFEDIEEFTSEFITAYTPEQRIAVLDKYNLVERIPEDIPKEEYIEEREDIQDEE